MAKLSPDTVAQRVTEQNFSCTSMVITLFGDVVSQHGGWVWMGSLINALSQFGYSERLVRTAVFRIVQQDWLQANKVGRRSYYCFTETAKGHYEKAARRIYAADTPEWDGGWTLVAPVFVPDEQREEFRKSLMWQGFNSLVSGLLAHPSSDRTSLDETLEELNLVDKAIVFSGSTADVHSRRALKELVSDKWQLANLEQQYSEVLNYYRGFFRRKKADSFSPREAFQIRVLLIHDYRRLLLRDPDFPDELLPTGWVGFEVQELVKRLYKQLTPRSEEYIISELLNAQGAMPGASNRFYRRFGGLPN